MIQNKTLNHNNSYGRTKKSYFLQNSQQINENPIDMNSGSISSLTLPDGLLFKFYQQVKYV
jgi:hypothetical protein